METNERKKRNESGIIIIEATIVFPVMFIVLFLIMFIGNSYYERAKVDAIVAEYAIKGAQSIVNPIQYQMVMHNTVPTDIKNTDFDPYRYLVGEVDKRSFMQNVEKEIAQRIKDDIENNSLIFSGAMVPKVTSKEEDMAEFNNYVLYATFETQVEYEIHFPIKMMGTKSAPIMNLRSRAEVSVNDVGEFMRNTDMIIDIFDLDQGGKPDKGLFSNLLSFCDKFKKK